MDNEIDRTELIRKIAGRAGVSFSTASSVLHDKQYGMRISKGTKQLVIDIAREMGFEPDSAEKKLKDAADSGVRQFVAVFWNRKLLTENIGDFFDGAYETISRHGFGVELVTCLYDEEKLSDYAGVLQAGHYSGIIVNGATQADSDFLERIALPIPVVLTSRMGKSLSSVHVDNFFLGRECARLFSQDGRRRAGVITTERHSTGSNMRETGFREGCKEFGIELRPEWDIVTHQFDIIRISDDLIPLMKQPEFPDCLFVQRSSMMPSIYTAMAKQGLRMPEDIAMIGGGLNHVLGRSTPSFSTVGGSMHAYGKSSLELVMLLIGKNTNMPINTVTPPVFEFHDSFRPARERPS